MNILQVCAYAAPYEGNFIKSLMKLDEELAKRGHQTIYAFCEYAKDQPWCKELQKHKKVYFLPQRHARIKAVTYIQLRKILKAQKINIVHSHFGLYDFPLGLVTPRCCQVFWHLHDPLIIGKSKKSDLFAKMQYTLFGKKAQLLSVCERYTKTAIYFGMPKQNAKTIINGIDLGRITYPYEKKTARYDFLTFGWDYYRKGIDILLSVMSELTNEGYRFKFLLNCLDSTINNIHHFFGGTIPEWLEIGKPVNDINLLFEQSKTFIQASRSETFSYAVCEAAYAGLDVISSNIDGLEWAHSIPSVEFFESENADQLLNILRNRLKDKKDVSKESIRKSREVIENNFSVSIWAQQIINEYEKIS